MATVLVFDRHPDEDAPLTMALQALGHVTLPARTLDEALDLYDSGRCDVAICELLVPGGGGLTFLHRVRAMDRRFPIILTTERTELADSPLFLRGMNEANAKIPKDASIFEFIQAITRVLEAERQVESKRATVPQDANEWMLPKS